MLETLNSKPLFVFLSVALLSSILTWVVRLVAHKVGFVSRPTADRWSKRTVALGGGIAIQLSILAGILWIDGGLFTTVLPAFLAVFILGVVDDIYGVPANAKLMVQTVAASWVVGYGMTLPLHSQVASIAFTIIWIVGVSNAVNLIDNMDGLAAGAATLTALGFAYLLHTYNASEPFVLLSVCIAAGAFGFLLHNFPPAKIFMGDAGSLPMGFLLAVVSTQLRFKDSQLPEMLAVIPVCLVLIVPLFDTALVMVARHNANKPLMSGGKDHTSHRLVALGLKDKSAVLVLYLFAILGSLSASLIMYSSIGEMIAFSVAALVSLILLGVFFLEVTVYPPSLFKTKKPGALPYAVLYAVELAVDICIVSVTWTLAHSIRFYDSGYQTHHMLSVIPTLPFLITLKLISFSLYKLYRGLWRTISGNDVYRIFKATSVGSFFLFVGLYFRNHLADTSRIVLILDWCLTFMAILGSRAAISAFRRWTRKLAHTPTKVALLGDSKLLDLVSKSLVLEKGMQFSGVISPDSQDTGKEVIGYADNLEAIVSEQDIDTLIVATDKFEDTLSQLTLKGVMLQHVKLQFT